MSRGQDHSHVRGRARRVSRVAAVAAVRSRSRAGSCELGPSNSLAPPRPRGPVIYHAATLSNTRDDHRPHASAHSAESY